MKLGRGRLALACVGVAALAACKSGLYRDTFYDEHNREVAEQSHRETACDNGDQDACASVGDALFLNAKTPGHVDDGLRLMRKSCAAGRPRGCMLLGDDLALDGTGKQDLDEAIAAFQRGCQLAGSDDGCLKAAGKLIDRGGAAEAHGKTMLSAMCGPGHAMACSQLGMAYLAEGKSWRVQSDLDQAALFHGRACQLEAVRCGYLAQQLAMFRLPAARALFASGCARGDAPSCDHLKRADANLAEDARLTARCDGGDEAACADLGQHLLTGGPLGNDVARALALLTPRCERTPPARFACRVLGDFFSDDRNPLVDPGKGARYLQRSSN